LGRPHLRNYHYFFEMVVSLVGRSAPPEMLRKLTYVAMKHDLQVKHVDTIRSYTFGALYFVEVSDSFSSFVLSLSGLSNEL
jgi:divalent metal cation (Fe/Co/Zn/Cd) transporter